MILKQYVENKYLNDDGNLNKKSVEINHSVEINYYDTFGNFFSFLEF